MKILRHRCVLAGLLLAALVLVAGCAGTAPASQPDTPAPSTAVSTIPAATDMPVATATSMMAESPLATPEVTAAATVTATAAMTGTTGASGSSGASGINEVTFTATEYKYDAPESMPAGWTRFTLDNQGERPHDLMLLKPEAGKTISDVLAALQSQGPPDWVELYGGTAAGPGETGEYTVNLEPGDYIAMSFGQNESGPPDAAQGMIHDFTVTGEAAEMSADALPEADATVDMFDYVFVITGTLSSGEQTIRVMNTGEELHEMQLFRLNEGFTFEQFKEMLDKEPTQGQEPPFEHVGGSLMSPGVDGFVTMNLEPGTHVMVCFIPSPEQGMQPHHKLGMIQQFEIQ